MSDSCQSQLVIPYLPTIAAGLQLECDLDNFIDRFVLTHGIWEPLVVAALSALVRPGDTCIDVGANAGYQSLLMGHFAGPTGRVYSFEPNLAIVRKLRRNLELNPRLIERVEIITFGLGDTPREMFVSPATDEGAGNAVLCDGQYSHTTHAVQIRTLDSFEIERVDCLKIDVEGMELEVLQGAERTLRRWVPHIIFETLTHHAPEKHRPLEDFLRSLGYQLFGLNLQTSEFFGVTYPYYPQEDTFAIHPARVDQRNEHIPR